MTDILSTHPRADEFPIHELRTAIDALTKCATSCATCSDACLSGDHVQHMTRCIALDTQCATVCFATAELLSRPSTAADSWPEALKACIEICNRCADERASHTDMQHCLICAEDCRACATACEALLAALPRN